MGTDQRGRAALALFVVGMVAVYALVIAEVSRAQFSLVDDYRAFALINMGAARATLIETLVDWRAPDAWLYRPFPDAISYSLASLLREHPGLWRVLMILVRIINVVVVFRIARLCAPSLSAACAAAAYFAFFPAIPELHLLRVEPWLVLMFALALLGWLRLEREKNAPIVLPAIVFVFATATKETFAPVLLILLALLSRHYWRRGVKGRVLLAILTAAVLFQSGRLLLVFGDPYARGGAGSSDLARNAFWAAKTLLLAVTSFPLVSVVLIVWLFFGIRELLRAPRIFAAGFVLLLAASVAVAIVAPYHAIRYLYPCALLLVPLIAIGARVEWINLAMIVLLAIFGGAQLVAQAFSARASTQADRALLEEAARTMSRGGQVVVIDDYDFERGFWIRAELVGVDPRWPFLTYVARQYARAAPVNWPAPPAGAVNVTGLVQPGGTFRSVPPETRITENALIVDANPLVVPKGYVVVREIDFRRDGALNAFQRAARYLNPKFRYEFDLGETPYPGYSWPILR